MDLQAFEERFARLEAAVFGHDNNSPDNACRAAAVVNGKVESLGELYNELEEVVHRLECSDVEQNRRIAALEEECARLMHKPHEPGHKVNQRRDSATQGVQQDLPEPQSVSEPHRVREPQRAADPQRVPGQQQRRTRSAVAELQPVADWSQQMQRDGLSPEDIIKAQDSVIADLADRLKNAEARPIEGGTILADLKTRLREAQAAEKAAVQKAKALTRKAKAQTGEQAPRSRPLNDLANSMISRLSQSEDLAPSLRSKLACVLADQASKDPEKSTSNTQSEAKKQTKHQAKTKSTPGTGANSTSLGKRPVSEEGELPDAGQPPKKLAKTIVEANRAHGRDGDLVDPVTTRHASKSMPALNETFVSHDEVTDVVSITDSEKSMQDTKTTPTPKLKNSKPLKPLTTPDDTTPPRSKLHKKLRTPNNTDSSTDVEVIDAPAYLHTSDMEDNVPIPGERRSLRTPKPTKMADMVSWKEASLQLRALNLNVKR